MSADYLDEFTEGLRIRSHPKYCGWALGAEYPKEDSIVESVREKFKSRSEVGIKKYNTTLDRDDLSLQQWLTHLQEELMDATLYVEKLMKETDETK